MSGGFGDTPTHGPRWLVLIGGGALLLAMAADFIAVIGRHTGMPLLGSIELVQASVLVSACVAMVVATLARCHAVVHLLVDRTAPPLRTWLIRANRLFSALMFLALFAGSLWIAADMWGGHEESEILRIPFAPLHLVAILSCLGVAGLFLRQAFERTPE